MVDYPEYGDGDKVDSEYNYDTALKKALGRTNFLDKEKKRKAEEEQIRQKNLSRHTDLEDQGLTI